MIRIAVTSEGWKFLKNPLRNYMCPKINIYVVGYSYVDVSVDFPPLHSVWNGYDETLPFITYFGKPMKKNVNKLAKR